jgi:hypothetical protein
MSSFHILAAAAVAAILATPVMALAGPNDPATDRGAPAASQQPGAVNPSGGDPSMAPSAGASATNASGVMTSQTTADQSGAIVTNTTVTNGPVPDTSANRAKFGPPMSNAGKRTAPAGN